MSLLGNSSVVGELLGTCGRCFPVGAWPRRMRVGFALGRTRGCACPFEDHGYCFRPLWTVKPRNAAIRAKARIVWPLLSRRFSPEPPTSGRSEEPLPLPDVPR